MATLTLEQLNKLMTDLESESVERTRAFDKIDKPNGTIEAPNGTIGNISNEQKILDAIKMHPGIKSAELTQVTGISRRTLYRVLGRLSQAEPTPIEYLGSKRYGGWHLAGKQL